MFYICIGPTRHYYCVFQQIMMKAEHFETTFPTCLLEPSTSQFRYAKYTSMIIYANIVNMICMYRNDYKRKQVILQLQSIAYRDMVYV